MSTILIDAEALAAVAPAMGERDNRPQLRGVAFYCDDGRTRAVATNGHVLVSAVCERSGWPEGMPDGLIVPCDAVKFALKNVKANGIVGFERDGDNIQVHAGNMRATFARVDAHFPDWRSVLRAAANAVPRDAAGRFPVMGGEVLATLAKCAADSQKRSKRRAVGWALHPSGLDNAVFGRMDGCSQHVRVYCAAMPFRANTVQFLDIEAAAEGVGA